MQRPVVLIVTLVAGALLVVGAGASAHTVSLIRSIGTHNAVLSDDQASGARTESPEPEESPEATPTAEPTQKPEPAENEKEIENEDNDEQEDEGEHHDGGGDHHGGDD